MSTCPESSVGISQGCWNSRFDLFDHNRDGLISAQDLSKTTAAGKNFTRQELQAGVAMAARWFPEEAGRLITHAPLITELALSEDLGKMGLDKVPAPNDPLPKLPPASLRRARLRFRSERGGGSALAALSPECLQGSVDVAASTLSLTFNILGMTLPNGKLVADILQGNNVVVESIVDTVHEKQEATDNLSIAQKVWQVFQILHDEGIFSEVLKASLADMDWWHFSVAVARAGATVASWYASGAALLVLQLALAVPNAVDLVQGLKAVHDQCRF